MNCFLPPAPQSPLRLTVWTSLAALRGEGELFGPVGSNSGCGNGLHFGLSFLPSPGWPAWPSGFSDVPFWCTAAVLPHLVKRGGAPPFRCASLWSRKGRMEPFLCWKEEGWGQPVAECTPNGPDPQNYPTSPRVWPAPLSHPFSYAHISATGRNYLLWDSDARAAKASVGCLYLVNRLAGGAVPP